MELTLVDLHKEILEIKELASLNRQAFNAKQAADYLSVGYDTITRLARIGDIDFVKNGTSYIFRRKHLDDWLDKQERRAKR